jgi:DNA-binding CsgD family transcriptional regulator
MASECGVLDLIDRIYATALLPEGELAWRELLLQLERHFVGSRAILALQDARSKEVSFFHAPHIDPKAIEAYVRYYASINPWWGVNHEEGSIHSGEMLVPEARMIRSEFYQDWLVPQGLHSGGGCIILKDRTRLMVFSFLKAPGPESVTADEFELMRMLLPHFQRAAQLRRQFGQLELRSRWVTHALDKLSTGVVLLQRPRRVVYVNELASTMLNGSELLYIDQAGSIRAKRSSDDIRLTKLIEETLTTTRPAGRGAGGAFAISGTEDHEAVSVLVTPYNPCADLSEELGPYATVLISTQGRRAEARTDVLSALYGPTRAEAQVLSKLVRGMSIHAIASAHGVSINTVRCQVQRLLEKTGTHRQSSLVTHVLADGVACQKR